MPPNTTPRPAPSLRALALAALCEPGPGEKVAAVQAMAQRAASVDTDAMAHFVDASAATQARPPPPSPLALPGCPHLPLLVAPDQVPRRSPFTPEGLAALLHAIAHIEFNAINLALDAIWRFSHLPTAYYTDWLQVATEEAEHFGLLQDHLHDLGHAYGNFPAHNGLWEMCVKTEHDATARMALVPRTLEARGLDATPLIQARLRKVGTDNALRAVAILEVILRDEIGHVAVGNRWYSWLCAQQGLDPLVHYRVLARRHQAPRLKPPFNLEARRAAGFSSAELEALNLDLAHAADNRA